MTPLQIFRDTIAPERMPIDDTYQGVVAYVDGRYAWPHDQIERFHAAGKHVYRISVTGANPRAASLADVERFDLDPAGGARYVAARNDLEGDGGIYCSRFTVPAVVKALGSEPAWLWVADWTGSPHVPALELPPHIKLALVQYVSLVGWDVSAVYSADWLGGRHIQ